MKMFKKKEKEPAYYMSATQMKVTNYHVYKMSVTERLLYTVLVFVVGALAGYLFYGGLGTDQYGNPTRLTYILNVVICVGVGLAALKLAMPVITNSLREKRQKSLKIQFRDMLDSLATSLNSGKNIMDSFQSVAQDLQVQYDADADILHELNVILTGTYNNIPIESLIQDFGRRSDVDDIESFANVFEICYRQGGNLRDVINNTHLIISEKMEIEGEIKTMAANNSLQQKIMIVIPVFLVAVIKLMSPEFAANFATPAGIIATTIAIVLFVIAYFVGKSVLDIKL